MSRHIRDGNQPGAVSQAHDVVVVAGHVFGRFVEVAECQSGYVYTVGQELLLDAARPGHFFAPLLLHLGQ